MKKKIIWAIVAILIIVAATLGILYFTTDLFKTPEQLFYKHFTSSSEVLGSANYKNYDEFMKELQKQKDSSLEVEGEITAKINSTNESDKELASILEKGKITYNQKTVGAEQKMQSDITLNYDNKDIVTLNVLQNKEQYGIKIDDLYGKYISLENNNLKQLFGKLGVDTTDIPDKIETIDYYELLNVDSATAEHISKTYSKVIKDNIPNECYSVKKNVTMKVDGVETTTNAYSLKMTETQLNNVANKFLEVLKTDDITLDLIVNKYNQLGTVNSYTMTKETMTKEELVKSIEDMLNDTEETNGNDTLEIIVYAAKENRSRIDIIVQENEQDAMKVEFEMAKPSNNEQKVLITLSAEEDTMSFEMKVSDNKKQDCIIKTDIDDVQMEISVKQEIKSTENVSVDNFTSDNSVKLNDMTTEEIGQLIQTMYSSALRVLPQKMQLLGINSNSI